MDQSSVLETMAMDNVMRLCLITLLILDAIYTLHSHLNQQVKLSIGVI